MWMIAAKKLGDSAIPWISTGSVVPATAFACGAVLDGSVFLPDAGDQAIPHMPRVLGVAGKFLTQVPVSPAPAGWAGDTGFASPTTLGAGAKPYSTGK
jgi:hypothetical protein